MQQSKSFFNKYCGSKSFYIKILLIMLPVTAHTLLVTLSQLVDNIMVGNLSETSIASVYISNQMFYIIKFIFFGVAGTSEIFISQYMGSNDEENVNRIFNITILVSILVGVLTFLFINLNYVRLISLFDTNPEVLELASYYLRIVSFTYVLFGINLAFGFGFRAYYMPKIPMYIGIFTVILNVILNYIFIFGFSNTFITIPSMGVQGAAISTLIVRAIETTIFIIISMIIKSPIRLTVRNLFKINFKILKKFVKAVIPLTSNEFLWASSITLLVLILANDNISFITGSHIKEVSTASTNRLASISIMYTYYNLFFMLIAGMAASTNIIIGKKLGAGKLDESKEDAYKLIGLSFVISIFSAILFALSVHSITVFYVLETEVLHYSKVLIFIMASMFPFSFINTVVFFILRVGGDIKNVFILDSMFSWVIIMPSALILRYYFNLNFLIVFAVVQSFELAKLFLGMYLINKGHWIRNLTH